MIVENVGLSNIEDENARQVVNQGPMPIEAWNAHLLGAQVEIEGQWDNVHCSRGEQVKLKAQFNARKPACGEYSSEVGQHRTRPRLKRATKATPTIYREQTPEVDRAGLHLASRSMAAKLWCSFLNRGRGPIRCSVSPSAVEDCEISKRKETVQVFQTQGSTGSRILRWMLVLLVAMAVVMPAGSAVAQGSSGWEIIDPPNVQTMYAIDMLDNTYGWAGGGAGFVWYYNTEAWWGAASSFIEPINGMSVLSRNSAWAVGWKGLIAHFDGSSWQRLLNTPPANSLNDVYMFNDAEGWAVGSGASGGAVFRYSGGTWREVASPVANQLNSVDFITPSDGWAVGLYGTVARWNGSNWTGGSPVSGPVSFNSVDMVSSNDVWIVGGVGSIYHFDGTTMTQVDSPTNKTLSDVKMWDADNGWAVGADGTILKYSNGSWSLVDSPTTGSLFAVDVVGPDEAWAVGKGGLLLHYKATPASLETSSKAVSTHHASAEDILTYTIQVKNTGTGVAPSVTVTDALDPLLLSLEGSPTTSKGTVTGNQPIVVAVGDLAPGEEATITFQAKVLDRGLTCWFVPNTATISADGLPELARSAATSVGTCRLLFLPLIVR